ncbi:MAG: HAMP domain-containing histidine kinase [Clostridiales bacterium]|jgi:signal transduction histidine kinase|nr:HAMP domain-containing histidine kinase [Clostridiales bacterium]
MDKLRKVRFFKSFRFRIMMFLFMSAVVALIATGVIYYAMVLFYRQNAVSGDTLHQIRILVNNIGEINVFAAVFLPPFFLAYLWLTRKYGKQLDDISKAISLISAGNFNVDIPVESDDEIGTLARDVNAAADKLKTAIETGEFAKNSKDRLVVNIAHDLRTPLTSISGYLGLIIDNQNLTDAQIKHYAEIAYKKSEKMERLIEDLFDFSRFNYGDNQLNKEKIDVVMLMKQILEEFYPSLIEKGLESRLFAEKTPVYIEADGYLLARVFDNLISNALRYGAEGKYIDAEIKITEGCAVIGIINYDSPIPAEELPHIFESFYRIEKSRSVLTGGTGLGLAIAKNIVELHGGEISVQSDILKTVFEIRLALPCENIQ